MIRTVAGVDVKSMSVGMLVQVANYASQQAKTKVWQDTDSIQSRHFAEAATG
jgi:hypothetical protein